MDGSRSDDLLWQRELIQCALEGRGLAAMADAAARYGFGVIVRDEAGAVLARAGDAPANAPVVYTAPAVYGRAAKARISFLAGARREAPADTAALDFAAGVMSLELYKQSCFAAAGYRRRNEWLYDILTGEADELPPAERPPLDFTRPTGCMIVDIDQYVKLSLAKSESDLDALRRRLYDVAARLARPGAQLLPRRDKLIVLASPPPEDGDAEAAFFGLARRLRQALAAEMPELTATIGLGRVGVSWSELRLSYAEAVDAVGIGRVAFGGDRVVRYRDLGIFLLLPTLRDNPGISRLFSHWLGGIVDYDRAKGTDLLKTLEVYLDANGDVRETVAKLSIHKNTLRYRLDKLNELTDGKMLLPINKLQYLLLIKIWRISK